MKEKNFEHTNISKIASRKPYANNRTGVRGVTISNGKYVARIRVQGKTIRLGTFSHLEQAAEARKKAEARYFGEILEEFANRKEK